MRRDLFDLARLVLATAVLAAAGWAGLLAAAKGAPVPKQAVTRELTTELIEGTWLYEWGHYPDGVISFNRDGSYVARHQLDSETFYVGTWTVRGDTVTIMERSFHPTWGYGSTEPTRYDFVFAPKGYPALTGKSNGAQKVAIWNRK